MIDVAAQLAPETAAFGATGLTRIAKNMQGSLILGIAGEVRQLIAEGRSIANLTVGDFDAKQFPIPQELRDATVRGYDAAQTNYPPPEGIAELRSAVCDWYARELGLRFKPDWVVVASGARPVMYATYRLFLEPGDTLLFSVPSWNNGYYAQLTDANVVTIETRAEDDFFPTAELLAPHLPGTRLFCLNSPLNPTGTVIRPERLAAIARAIVAENERRRPLGERPLFWMFDQVYWRLTFGGVPHAHPVALVPEVAPYVITVDAISKAFAATGLRVGWAVLPPVLAERMKSLIGHVGAWAPRPEQAGTAAFLHDAEALERFEAQLAKDITSRLDILHEGLTALGVTHLVPRGAIYLSVRFDRLFGRPGHGGGIMQTNEDIRKFLLHEAGVAVVPFQAFDMDAHDGWFRMSIGAASPDALRGAIERLERVLGA